MGAPHRHREPERSDPDGRPVGLAGQTFAECRRHRLGVSTGPPSGLRQQLDEWRERDADAVRGGLTDEDGRSLAGSFGELGRKARLTHAGRSQHGDEHARPGIDHVIERLFQHPKRALAPYQRSLDPRRHLAQLEHSPGGHRLNLALRGHRFDVVSRNSVAHETPCRLPDQNRPGRSTRLKARCGVHRVTDDRSADPGHEYFACGDADPGRKRDRSNLVQRLMHSCMSIPARTARSASSSCAFGTPKTAETASPMNFSTRPPWRSIAERISVK